MGVTGSLVGVKCAVDRPIEPQRSPETPVSLEIYKKRIQRKIHTVAFLCHPTRPDPAVEFRTVPPNTDSRDVTFTHKGLRYQPLLRTFTLPSILTATTLVLPPACFGSDAPFTNPPPPSGRRGVRCQAVFFATATTLSSDELLALILLDISPKGCRGGDSSAFEILIFRGKKNRFVFSRSYLGERGGFSFVLHLESE